MKQLIIVILSVLFVSCSQQNQEPRQPAQQAVTQAKPGEETPATLISESKKKLADAKAQLAQQGKYGCCIKEPCNMCVLDEGECDCYDDLKKGEHVCIECYAGWQQGKGADPKINKENVTTSFVKHEHHQ